jgi:hypothetical protein
MLSEISRLTWNAAFHREDLLLTSIKKSRWRKALIVAAGLLSLLSAGAIATVMSSLLPKFGTQLLAAIISAVSGAISLVSAAYFAEHEIMAMFTGASEYLTLRESAYRIVTAPEFSDNKRFTLLTELQKEYAKLDKTYARYFTLKVKHDGKLRMRSSEMPKRLSDLERAEKAASEAIGALHELSEFDPAEPEVTRPPEKF